MPPPDGEAIDPRWADRQIDREIDREALNPESFKVPWTKRRWVMYSTLAWAIGEVTYINHFIRDPAELASKAVISQALIALIAALVLGYLGFAVQDDRSRRAAIVSYAARVPLTRRPSAPPDDDVTGRVDEPR